MKIKMLFLLSFFSLLQAEESPKINAFDDVSNAAVRRFVISRADRMVLQKKDDSKDKRFSIGEKIKKYFTNMLASGASNEKKYVTSLELYEYILQQIAPMYDTEDILSPNTFTDLDIVREDRNDILEIMRQKSGTKTLSGEVVTFLTALHPTTDVKVLKNRQNFIKLLMQNRSLFVELEDAVSKFLEVEKKFLEYLLVPTASEAEIKMLSCRYIPGVDDNKTAWNTLTNMTLVGFACTAITMPSVAGVSSMLLYKNYNKWDGTTKIMSAYGIFFPLYFTFSAIIVIDLWASIIKKLQEPMIHFATAVRQAKKIYALLKQNNLLTKEFLAAVPELQALHTFIFDPELTELFDSLHTNTFSGKASAFSDWGNIFVTYNRLEKLKGKFIPVISALGCVDTYLSLAKLMHDQEPLKQGRSESAQFCFANYILNRDEPVLVLEKAWNPIILSHKRVEGVITNSIDFGKKRAMVVTGPNTCGKTAITTSYVIAALFAQTFGIVPALSCEMTPFNKLYVLLTIRSDGAIGDSRFNAELREMKTLINHLKNSFGEGKLTLAMLDEIFTGTNPEDGEYAAQMFLNALMEENCCNNCFLMLATHYPTLTKFESLDKRFVNYTVLAERLADNGIKRYFKLVPGVSKLSIARDLLANAGFSAKK